MDRACNCESIGEIRAKGLAQTWMMWIEVRGKTKISENIARLPRERSYPDPSLLSLFKQIHAD
jgi:hypothetical protein